MLRSPAAPVMYAIGWHRLGLSPLGLIWLAAGYAFIGYSIRRGTCQKFFTSRIPKS